MPIRCSRRHQSVLAVDTDDPARADAIAHRLKQADAVWSRHATSEVSTADMTVERSDGHHPLDDAGDCDPEQLGDQLMIVGYRGRWPSALIPAGSPDEREPNERDDEEGS